MAFVLPVDDWIAPLPGVAPSGVLEPIHETLDDAFPRIIGGQPAVLGKSESDQTIIVEAERDPDWGALRTVAAGMFAGGRIPNLVAGPGDPAFVVCKPVRHLRAAIVLAVAALHTDGFAGFADGLGVIEGLLSGLWDSVHPQRDDDPDDPFFKRLGVLRRLQVNLGEYGDPWRVYERVCRAQLIRSERHGDLCLADALRPWKDLFRLALPEGPLLGQAAVFQARLDFIPRIPEQVAALREAARAAGSIQAQVAGKAGVATLLDLSALVQLLGAGADLLEDRLPAPAGATAPAGAKGPGGTPVAPVPTAGGSVSGPVRTGPIGSREDAIRALIEVAAFYERNEPSSPIPLLVKRVQKLASLDFLSLLQELELGAEAVPAFKKLAGVRDDPAAAAAPTGDAAP